MSASITLPVNTMNRCSSDESDGGSAYMAAFIVAMVLIPIGTIPLHVLGINYLDDASPHGTFAVHFGIYNYTYDYLYYFD